MSNLDTKKPEPGKFTKNFVALSILGWVPWVTRFSASADKIGMSEDVTALYLHRRVSEVRDAASRSHTLWGRIYNKLTGSHVDQVNLSGAVIRTAFKALNITLPDDVRAYGEYCMPLHAAEDLLSKYSKLMREKGVIK